MVREDHSTRHSTSLYNRVSHFNFVKVDLYIKSRGRGGVHCSAAALQTWNSILKIQRRAEQCFQSGLMDRSWKHVHPLIFDPALDGEWESDGVQWWDISAARTGNTSPSLIPTTDLSSGVIDYSLILDQNPSSDFLRHVIQFLNFLPADAQDGREGSITGRNSYPT